jgi:AbrB family looped-hinge helix DNA binding protein
MKTALSSKGQIVIPAELVEKDRLKPGQQFEVERIRAGEYLLRRVPAPGTPGVLAWLLSCPEKDWFQPIPPEQTR